MTPTATSKPKRRDWAALDRQHQRRGTLAFTLLLNPEVLSLKRSLGLSGEEELPALLQGWSRLPDTRVAGTEHMIRWAWNDLSEGHVYVLDDELKVPPDVSRQGFMEAKVSLNSQSYSASALCC